MQKIVNQVCYTSKDRALIIELVDLSRGFDGMSKRRVRLESYLDKLATVRQGAAIQRYWDKIHGTVAEFTAEISVASSSLSSGGSGIQ